MGNEQIAIREALRILGNKRGFEWRNVRAQLSGLFSLALWTGFDPVLSEINHAASGLWDMEMRGNE